MGGRFTLYLLTTYDGFISHKPELAGKVIQLTRVITAITPSELITAIKPTHRRTGTSKITQNADQNSTILMATFIYCRYPLVNCYIAIENHHF